MEPLPGSRISQEVSGRSHNLPEAEYGSRPGHLVNNHRLLASGSASFQSSACMHA